MRLQQVTTARRALRLLARQTWGSEREVAPGGKGDAVLVLHGFCGTSRMMRPLARFLRRELGRPVHLGALGLGLDDIRSRRQRGAAVRPDGRLRARWLLWLRERKHLRREQPSARRNPEKTA